MGALPTPLLHQNFIEVLAPGAWPTATAYLPSSGIDTQGWEYAIIVFDNGAGLAGSDTVTLRMQESEDTTFSGSVLQWDFDSSTPSTKPITLVVPLASHQRYIRVRIDTTAATTLATAVSVILWNHEDAAQTTTQADSSPTYLV